MDYCRGRGHCNISIQLSEEISLKMQVFTVPTQSAYTQRENSPLP